jgi:hypothetical protein
MIAARSAPRSDPAKSHDFRPKAGRTYFRRHDDGIDIEMMIVGEALPCLPHPITLHSSIK